MEGWIGVDLDGTLAHYEGWGGMGHIGAPVPAMLERVLGWIASGYEVRIFTARASVPEAIPYIEAWLVTHGMPGLAITNVKDFGMVELWDDRAVTVEANTGNALAPSTRNICPNHHPVQHRDMKAAWCHLCGKP